MAHSGKAKTLRDFAKQPYLSEAERFDFIQVLFNSITDLITAIDSGNLLKNFKLRRATVEDINLEGGTGLSFPADTPRNAIRASIKGDIDDELKGSLLFYPMSSNMLMPLAKGQVVYVFIEVNTKDPNIPVGIWLSSVTDSLFNERPNKNISDPRGLRSGAPRFIKRPGDFALTCAHNALFSLQNDRPGNDLGEGVDKEDSATVEIVVGRSGERKDGLFKQTTSQKESKFGNTKDYDDNIEEGQPNFYTDRARLYTSMNTNGDFNFHSTKHMIIEPLDSRPENIKDIDIVEKKDGIEYVKNYNSGQLFPLAKKDNDVNWENKLTETSHGKDKNNRDLFGYYDTSESSFAVAKADCIRNIARHSVKIESRNEICEVCKSNNTIIKTGKFIKTKGKDGKDNIGSSIILTPDGVILIETQNKKGMIRIDPDSEEKFIDISVKSTPQHIAGVETLGSIIMSADGTVVVDSKKEIHIGKNAVEHAMLGDKTVAWLKDYLKHTHPTGVGPSGPPVEAAVLDAKTGELLSKNVTIKEDLAT